MPIAEGTSGDLLVAGFTLVGTVVGALIAAAAQIIASRIDRKWDRVKAEASRLSEQVEAYYELSKRMADDLSLVEGQGRAAVTVLIDYRGRVEGEGFSRPDMTSREARNIRRRLT
jgi:hypothetical protein